MRTRLLTLPIVLAAGLAVSSLALAQAPAGSTGACKDGTYTTQAKKRGACKGHGGVKEWYASEGKSTEKASGEKTATESKSHKKESKKESKNESEKEKAVAAGGSAGASAAAGGAAVAPASSMASSHKAPKGMRAEAAPGGGAGKVWVNTATHTYHCSGDQWYGKTKEGEYMTEAEAKAKGDHPSHGKACG